MDVSQTPSTPSYDSLMQLAQDFGSFDPAKPEGKKAKPKDKETKPFATAALPKDTDINKIETDSKGAIVFDVHSQKFTVDIKKASTLIPLFEEAMNELDNVTSQEQRQRMLAQLKGLKEKLEPIIKNSIPDLVEKKHFETAIAKSIKLTEIKLSEKQTKLSTLGFWKRAAKKTLNKEIATLTSELSSLKKKQGSLESDLEKISGPKSPLVEKRESLLHLQKELSNAVTRELKPLPKVPTGESTTSRAGGAAPGASQTGQVVTRAADSVLRATEKDKEKEITDLTKGDQTPQPKKSTGVVVGRVGGGIASKMGGLDLSKLGLGGPPPKRKTADEKPSEQAQPTPEGQPPPEPIRTAQQTAQSAEPQSKTPELTHLTTERPQIAGRKRREVKRTFVARPTEKAAQIFTPTVQGAPLQQPAGPTIVPEKKPVEARKEVTAPTVREQAGVVPTVAAQVKRAPSEDEIRITQQTEQLATLKAALAQKILEHTKAGSKSRNELEEIFYKNRGIALQALEREMTQIGEQIANKDQKDELGKLDVVKIAAIKVTLDDDLSALSSRVKDISTDFDALKKLLPEAGKQGKNAIAAQYETFKTNIQKFAGQLDDTKEALLRPLSDFAKLTRELKKEMPLRMVRAKQLVEEEEQAAKLTAEKEAAAKLKEQEKRVEAEKREAAEKAEQLATAAKQKEQEALRLEAERIKHAEETRQAEMRAKVTKFTGLEQTLQRKIGEITEAQKTPLNDLERTFYAARLQALNNLQRDITQRKQKGESLDSLVKSLENIAKIQSTVSIPDFSNKKYADIARNFTSLDMNLKLSDDYAEKIGPLKLEKEACEAQFGKIKDQLESLAGKIEANTDAIQTDLQAFIAKANKLSQKLSELSTQAEHATNSQFINSLSSRLTAALQRKDKEIVVGTLRPDAFFLERRPELAEKVELFKSLLNKQQDIPSTLYATLSNAIGVVLPSLQNEWSKAFQAVIDYREKAKLLDTFDKRLEGLTTQDREALSAQLSQIRGKSLNPDAVLKQFQEKINGLTEEELQKQARIDFEPKWKRETEHATSQSKPYLEMSKAIEAFNKTLTEVEQRVGAAKAAEAAKLKEQEHQKIIRELAPFESQLKLIGIDIQSQEFFIKSGARKYLNENMGGVILENMQKYVAAFEKLPSFKPKIFTDGSLAIGVHEEIRDNLRNFIEAIKPDADQGLSFTQWQDQLLRIGAHLTEAECLKTSQAEASVEHPQLEIEQSRRGLFFLELGEYALKAKNYLAQTNLPEKAKKEFYAKLKKFEPLSMNPEKLNTVTRMELRALKTEIDGIISKFDKKHIVKGRSPFQGWREATFGVNQAALRAELLHNFRALAQ